MTRKPNASAPQGHDRPRGRFPLPLLPHGLVFLAFAIAIGQAPLSAQDGPRTLGGSLIGRVVDGSTLEGLSGVEVRDLTFGSTVLTDGRGRFRIDPIQPGTHQLVFSRIGYASRTDTVQVPLGQVLAVTASLSQEPVEVEPLVVAVRSGVLDRAGFYERRSQGMRGFFLERADIEERQPDVVTDLFRRMTGIRVMHGGLHGSYVIVNQRVTFGDSAMGCEPSIWLDGIRSGIGTPDILQVEELEGIEVYIGASAPGKFNDVCGVIVLWTRKANG